MFDNQQRSTAFQQFAECAEQLGNVIEMQSRRRFVENVEDALIVGAAQVRRQLQALRFSARKRCRRLSETQVAEANLIQNSEFGNDLWNIDEKSQGFADRELQYLVDILPVIPHFQNAALEARAPALLTDQLDVDRKSTRLNSSHSQISYAVFCLKKKKTSFYEINNLIEAAYGKK